MSGSMGLELTSSSSSMKPEATKSSSSEQAPRPIFLSAVLAAFTERAEESTPRRRACISSEYPLS